MNKAFVTGELKDNRDMKYKFRMADCTTIQPWASNQYIVSDQFAEKDCTMEK